MKTTYPPKAPQTILLVILFLPIAVVGLVPSISHAISCTVGFGTNPPGGKVDPATDCGIGTGNNNTGSGNPGAAQLNSLAVGGSTTWTEIMTRQEDSGWNSKFFFTGEKSGLFFINTDLLDFSQFALVLKDGNTLVNPGPGPERVAWAWFLLPSESTGDCLWTYEICGQWSMWGNPNGNGNRVEISHMTLYGAGRSGQLPTPGTLLLLGTGLIGLAVVARKTGWAQKSGRDELVFDGRK